MATLVEHHLGPAASALLRDPDTAEIYSDPGSRHLWVLSRTRGRVCTEVPVSPKAIHRFLNASATALDLEISPKRPRLEGALPEGQGRIMGLIPPVLDEPGFFLRLPHPAVPSLESYVASGIMEPHHEETLREALRHYLNILVVGGTGTGKTTLLNALLEALLTKECPADRLVTLEDTRELVLPTDGHWSLLTDPFAGIRLEHLLEIALRSSPSRILVGEVRDHSVLTLLDSWFSGHPGGLATLHADTAGEALERVRNLILRAVATPQYALESQID